MVNDDGPQKTVVCSLVQFSGSVSIYFNLFIFNGTPVAAYLLYLSSSGRHLQRHFPM